MHKPYISNETLLFPPCLGDLIPADAPVRLLSDIVDHMDLSEIYATYSQSEEGGRPSYHPAMLMKVVLFGYMERVYSSRGLETALSRDVHLMWLASLQKPDHATIGRFKQRCLPYIKTVFAQLIRILAERGEISLEKELYIDGTTIRSRASRHRIKWRSSAEKFSAAADAAIQEAIQDLYGQIDAGIEEDKFADGHVEYTVEEVREMATRVDEAVQKKGLRNIRGRITALRKACDRKEAHDRTIELCDGRCGVSPTDPECGIMHAKEDGYDGKPTPNYNVQIATQNQYVTNYGAYDSTEDKSVAMEFIETCVSENGTKPAAVVEDAGYGCEEVYVGLEELGIEAVVKYPMYDRQSRRRPVPGGHYDPFGFRLSPDRSTLICPAGHTMRVTGVVEAYTRRGFRSDSTTLRCDRCSDCPFWRECVVPRNKNNEIRRKLGNIREEEKARSRLDSPLNRQRLRRRNLEPEPVFGQLKHNHGYTRFRHFGKAAVTMDLGFVFMALNILKLYRNMKKSAKKG